MWRTSGTGIPVDGALIDHNREGKAGVGFCLRHNQLSCVIDAVVRPVPVDDHSIDAAADHVCNLAVNLGRIVRSVPDIHVVRTAEPQHQVSVDFGRRTWVQQSMNIDFADVVGPHIPIRLVIETVGRTRVVCLLVSQRGGRNNRSLRGAHTGSR